MPTRELSPREQEIVKLCVDGLTNEAIAHKLQISLGTVNTYWVRLKHKVGGMGRTDTVVKVILQRAENALRQANTECNDLARRVEEQERSMRDQMATIKLLNFAIDKLTSSVWATDRELAISVIANGDLPTSTMGTKWECGRSIYDVCNARGSDSRLISAHLAALEGITTETRLDGPFDHLLLKVSPFRDDSGKISGCLGLLNVIRS